MPRHPTKQTKPLQSPKTKITHKASQTADLNCLNFELAVPPPKTGPHPKFMSHQVKSTLNLIYSQGTRLQTHRN